MADNDATNNDNQDDQADDQVDQKPSLDSLTDEAQEEFNSEDAEAKAKAKESEQTDEAEDDDDTKDSDTASADDTDSQDDEAEDSEDETDDQTDDDTDTEAKELEQAKDETDEPSSDGDTTKPGTYKVKFTDAEGKDYYVHDADELPDDFEPRTYKEFAQANQKLPFVQAALSRDKYSYQQTQKSQADTDRQAKLGQSFQASIKQLQAAGELPKDAAKLQKATAKVYDFMESELNTYVKTKGQKGSILDNFAVAHELFQAREARKSTQDKQDQIVANKKKRGAMIGSTGNNNAASKVIKAPASGTTLDSLHEQVTGSL